jgi:hypothetical protein
LLRAGRLSEVARALRDARPPHSAAPSTAAPSAFHVVGDGGLAAACCDERGAPLVQVAIEEGHARLVAFLAALPHLHPLLGA